MKILVTGATGFVGHVLCKALFEKGFKIRALVFPGEDYSHILEFVDETVQGDIGKPETLVGVGDDMDVVYHLAARVLDYGSKKDFYDSILEGTRNMLIACSHKAKRFVYISSICACGTGNHMKGMTENDTCKKTGVYYGDAKLDAEILVRSYADRFSNGWVIARPANVIGPQSVWVREVGSMFQKSIVPLFDKGRHSASLVNVDNLVDGLVLTGEVPEAGNQIYFFRDDWQVTWKKYLTDLSAMLGKRPIGSVPFLLVWYIGAIAEAISKPLRLRPFATRSSAGLMGRDNDVITNKAQNELGWKTTVSYEKAMDKIEEWVKENMI